jgi:hypothetical protein
MLRFTAGMAGADSVLLWTVPNASAVPLRSLLWSFAILVGCRRLLSGESFSSLPNGPRAASRSITCVLGSSGRLGVHAAEGAMPSV